MDELTTEEASKALVVPQWTFQKDLEKQKESAQDMITRQKQALYQLNQLRSKIKVAEAQQENMECMSHIEPLYRVLAEEHKQKFIIYESEREKYEEQVSEFDEERCIQCIQQFGKYLKDAGEFINVNDLHGVVEIKQVMDKSAMEEYTLKTYKDAKATYEKYKELKDSWLYKMFPFTRPWNYDESMGEKKNFLLKSIEKLQKIIGHFPEMKERLSYEKGAMQTFQAIASSMRKVCQGNLAIEDFEKVVSTIKVDTKGDVDIGVGIIP